MMNVNTEEVRRAAREIKQISLNVADLYSADVNRMRSSVESELKGETANALSEVLGNLGADIQRIASSLLTISNKLQKYAEDVEEADRKAEQAIIG